MTDLVTVEQAKDQIFLGTATGQDAWLALAITAISAAIADWAGGEDRVVDSDGDPLPVAQQACLVELAFQYRYREGGSEEIGASDWKMAGYSLSQGATALLQSLHKPRLQ